jgi:hypothetical protein
MKPVTLYAIGRLVFGAAALAAPAPAAQACLRGMGGREIGLGLGLLAMIRANGPIRPWIIAGLLADSGDITGIAGAWRHMPRQNDGVVWGWPAPPRQSAPPSWPHHLETANLCRVNCLPAKAFRSLPASSSSMSRSGSQLVEPPKDRGQRDARG